MRYIILISCLMFSCNVAAQEDLKLDEWVYTKTVDPFTDLISSNTIIWSSNGKEYVSLGFHCSNQKGFAFSVTTLGVSLKDSARLQHNFVYRIDKMPAIEQKFNVGTTNSLITAEHFRIVRDINVEGGETIIVKVRVNELDSIIARFPLKGAPENIAKVADDCMSG